MSPQKKQALQKILEALIPYWDLAEWFLLILEKWENDELIEQLYDKIKSEIKKINNEKNRKNIKNTLKQIKKKEEKEKQEENEYLEDLISNI